MTIDEAIEWIADIFQEPSENILPETQRLEIPAWDSLGFLSLMARLDEDHDILLKEEDLQQIRKVDDILEVMRRHGVLNHHS